MTKRTLAEIYDQLATEKANNSELSEFYTHYWDNQSTLDDHTVLMDDLNSGSKVAIWRLLLWVVAVAIWIHESFWFVFKDEVEEMLDAQIAHTARWYQQESLNFQYGDEIIWDDKLRKYRYSYIDKDKQIIAKAAVKESLGSITIKVATLTNDVLAALSAEQKTAFEAFWQKWKDAGVILNIISDPADILKLSYDIYYDAVIINSSGELISDTSVRPVDDAILDYLANLDFNGTLKLEEIDAAIGAVKGVVSFKRTGAQWKYGTYDYKDIDILQTANSGYFVIDPDNPLTATIQYIG